MNDYNKQAQDFLEKTGTKFKARYLRHDLYFADDKDARDIYRITLKRDGKQYSFNFGQSIANVGKEPTPYNVLSCVTKYDPGDFDEFCSEYGYDNGSHKAHKNYLAVVREYKNIDRLFNDVMDDLAEIN